MAEKIRMDNGVDRSSALQSGRCRENHEWTRMGIRIELFVEIREDSWFKMAMI
jgi:hypothetical protein